MLFLLFWFKVYALKHCRTFSSQYVGVVGTESKDYAAYAALLEIAELPLIQELLKAPNPACRAYASLMLFQRFPQHFFELTLNHPDPEPLLTEWDDETVDELRLAWFYSSPRIAPLPPFPVETLSAQNHSLLLQRVLALPVGATAQTLALRSEEFGAEHANRLMALAKAGESAALLALLKLDLAQDQETLRALIETIQWDGENQDLLPELVHYFPGDKASYLSQLHQNMAVHTYPGPDPIYRALFQLPCSQWQPLIERDLASAEAENEYFLLCMARALASGVESDPLMKKLVLRLWRDHGYLHSKLATQFWKEDPKTCVEILHTRHENGQTTPESQEWPLFVALAMQKEPDVLQVEAPGLLALAPAHQFTELLRFLKQKLAAAALPTVEEQVQITTDCDQLEALLKAWQEVSPQNFALDAKELLTTFSDRFEQQDPKKNTCFEEFLARTQK